jgi:hypothetical protein
MPSTGPRYTSPWYNSPDTAEVIVVHQEAVRPEDEGRPHEHNIAMTCWCGPELVSVWRDVRVRLG